MDDLRYEYRAFWSDNSGAWVGAVDHAAQSVVGGLALPAAGLQHAQVGRAVV